jgi:hypothetical protein
MFTVKAYSEVKPGDVLKVAGQAIYVLAITPRVKGGFWITGEDDKREHFNFTQSTDRFVKCFNWTYRDWQAFCDDDLEAWNH